MWYQRYQIDCTSGHAEICTAISTFLFQVIPAGVQSIWFEHENKLIIAALRVWFFHYHRQTAYYYPAVAGSSVFSLSTIWAVFRLPVLVYLKTGVFIFITVYENEWEMDRWMDGSWLSLTAHYSPHKLFQVLIGGKLRPKAFSVISTGAIAVFMSAQTMRH